MVFKFFIIDICGFKRINEVFSYQLGDEIFKFFVFCLQVFVGNSGFIVRIGSNEFVLVKCEDMFKDELSEQYVKNFI